MKEIDIVPNGYRAFTAILKGEMLGRLEYPKWYSAKARITLGNDVQYILEPKGFWQTSQELKKDGTVIMEMKMKWNGSILIWKPKDAERAFEFKLRGFFKQGYVLNDYKGNQQLAIVTDFNWKKFNSGYIITCGDEFGSNEFEELLILLSVHYCKAMQNAAASAAAT
jgi:hypothetical protein